MSAERAVVRGALLSAERQMLCARSAGQLLKSRNCLNCQTFLKIQVFARFRSLLLRFSPRLMVPLRPRPGGLLVSRGTEYQYFYSSVSLSLFSGIKFDSENLTDQMHFRKFASSLCSALAWSCSCSHPGCGASCCCACACGGCLSLSCVAFVP